MDQAVSITPNQAQTIIYNRLRTFYGLPDPIAKIITAQSGHETGGWLSPVYKTDNNLFGYGYDGNGNYTYYPYGIQDSIDDLVGWLDRHVPGYEAITVPGDYAAAIRAQGYYTDSLTNYSNGISRWLNNNLQIAAGLSVVAVVGIGLLIYFIVNKK
jgi:hypothetical protein